MSTLIMRVLTEVWHTDFYSLKKVSETPLMILLLCFQKVEPKYFNISSPDLESFLGTKNV